MNFIVFDRETRNKIDNSSNIISSIDRVNDEEQNMSYTQKLKINDNNYITLTNNKENLIEFINEIKFNKNNNKIKLKKEKENDNSLINHSSSINQKIAKNIYLMIPIYQIIIYKKIENSIQAKKK